MKKVIIFIVCSAIFSISNAQGTIKDTIFLKLDSKYIYESLYVPNHFLLEDSSDIGKGTFYFEKLENNEIIEVKPKKVHCLKKMVRSSRFYDKKIKKLDDDGLFEYFNDFIIFLVKTKEGKKEFIKVRANWEIE
ncbi:hypothetical protein SAMN04489722_103155 [Algibacter lectus]|uniref:hypothetical protein n=1 Tax=Algibacter lectus TaxID=221126 RepID=UPI0008E1AAF2|nr:hypothetical protein [Algibacter lectus]SFC68125.1 hypothetical protein SAMN04489722_103155 [Algibacter lectus]